MVRISDMCLFPFSGKNKGVMVPPTIVDVNKDGVQDIVVSLFEGKVLLKDGKTATTLWETDYADMESYKFA